MAVTVTATNVAGLSTLYASARRISDGYFYDVVASAFAANPTSPNRRATFTEVSPGRYQTSFSGFGDENEVAIAIYNSALGTTAIGGTTIYVRGGVEVANTGLTITGGKVDVNSISAIERTALANEVEAQIIDETDTEKVLTAITNKIAAANPDLSGLTLAAIAAAVRTNLTAELGLIDAAISSRATPAQITAAQNVITAAISTRQAAGAVTLDLTQVVDGVAVSALLTELRRSARAPVVPTVNNDGTTTYAFKNPDNSTSFSVTYNPTTGARS